jgi:hypothetical protein
MKQIIFFVGIVLILSVYTNRIQAQTTETKLNQIELMKQFLGTWQMETDKDSVLEVEVRQYGKAFVETDYRIINGEKSWLSVWCYSFSSKEDKFKIFALYLNGSSSTWIAAFTSEKKWIQERVQNFNPDKVFNKAEIVFDTPSNVTVTNFNSEGVKTNELKVIKVK